MFFNSIHKNFIDNKSKIPKIGDYYKEIVVKRYGKIYGKLGHVTERYEECMVTHSKANFFMGEYIYNVGIKPKGAEKSMLVYWDERSGFVL